MYAKGEHCDQYLLSRMWTKERPEWTKEIYRQSQTDALLSVGRAFAKFFKKITRHPKFHKKGHKDSFYVDNGHGFVRNQRFHIPNIGDVRMSEQVRFEGRILGFWVTRHADQWYVSVIVELANPPTEIDNGSCVGVDVGSKHWAVSSDGEVLDRPKQLGRIQKHLKHLQKNLCRKKKKSSNRSKASIRFARVHRRLHRIKMDAIHKFTSRLAKNHSIVCCEDLYVKGMKQSVKAIRKAVRNSGMFEIRAALAYKASHYVEIDRWFPSSKRCSQCGHVKLSLSLNDRTYKCLECGSTLGRDLNAAINIRDEGFRIFTEGHSESACGGC